MTPPVQRSVLDKVINILLDHFQFEYDRDIKLEDTITDDLGADSLDRIEIGMALEEEFDIEITDDDAEKFKTVSDIVKFIEVKRGA